MEKQFQNAASEQVEQDNLYNKRREFKTRNKKQQIISDPIVDKIRLLKTFRQRGDMPDFINVLNSENLSFCVEAHTSRGRYTASKTIYLPSNDLNDPEETMWVGVNSYKNQITLEYCPAKLSDRAYDLIDNDVFGKTRYGSFTCFITDAKIMQMEVCRNIFNMKMEDYIFRGSWFKKHGFYTGQEGRVETIYMGGKDQSQLVFYDKKKQDKKNYLEYDSVVRVERMHKSPGILVRDLPEYKNPFPRAEIFEFALLKLNHVPARFRRCFMYACWSVGVSNALASLGLTESQKEKAMRQFRSNPWSPWIEAQENWKSQWLEALEAYHLLDATAQKDDE